MPFVNKARRIDPNLRKTNVGLTKREKEIYTIYSNAFKGVRNQLGDQKVLRDIMDALRTNSASGVNNAINWRTFLESLNNTAPALAAQMVEVANLHSKVLPKKVQYQYNFESKDPRAIAWAQTQAGKRIQGITLETQQAVADLIADGLRTKLSRDEIVAQLKQTVGLDKRQSKALGNFYMKRLEKYLEDGLTYEEAAAKAEKNGVRYRDKLLRQRAIRIARTEISSAANAGRYLSWEEANARGLLPPDSKKRWLTNIDERTCPICQPLNGTLIPWQGTFSTGDIMPPAHPNCRCTSVIVPGEIQVIKSVEKHAPGRHNQQSHAGGLSGKKYSNLNQLVRDLDDNKNPENEAKLLELSTSQKVQGDKVFLKGYVENWAIGANRRLREGPLKEDDYYYKERIDGLDKIIAGTKPIDTDITVYRGVSPAGGKLSIFTNLKVGDVIEDKGYLSTSLSPRFAAEMADAESFNPIDQGFIFEINVPAQTQGIFSNSLLGLASEGNDYEDELEFLMPRGTSLKVLSNKGRVWQMEVVK
jgi:SPP1 gp7 family putative phage head morphogenesis protein